MSATLLQSAPVAAPSAAATVRTRRAGLALSAVPVLFLAFDAAIKLAGARPAVEGGAQLGFAPHHVLTLGLIQVVCLALYLVPRTAVLGAVLWTGYFGGAIATHLRLDNPLLTHTLFPIYVAALLWAGLYLRDPRVRAAVRPTR